MTTSANEFGTNSTIGNSSPPEVAGAFCTVEWLRHMIANAPLVDARGYLQDVPSEPPSAPAPRGSVLGSCRRHPFRVAIFCFTLMAVVVALSTAAVLQRADNTTTLDET